MSGPKGSSSAPLDGHAQSRRSGSTANLNNDGTSFRGGVDVSQHASWRARAVSCPVTFQSYEVVLDPNGALHKYSALLALGHI
ncbi:hypothetical protein PGT21_030259 [Puccinia graminis f. sp. tritici]|uniref:Uncharacterized protein n=1 Tax=Puccinia graminis f. sp. tritici TaxID=56615 RepID=A0A5B0R210_PUCGR|nr:hypothetical protein PGT21_030259 [Puccinia graminis f. sp. tritici]